MSHVHTLLMFSRRREANSAVQENSVAAYISANKHILHELSSLTMALNITVIAVIVIA